MLWPRPQQILSQFFSRWHLRPAVPGEKRPARQKLGESSRWTSSGVRGSGSPPPDPEARPRGGEMAPASPVASLVVLPTLSAVSYLCFRCLPTSWKGASCRQQVRTVQEPDTPWHLQVVSTPAFITCSGEWKHEELARKAQKHQRGPNLCLPLLPTTQPLASRGQHCAAHRKPSSQDHRLALSPPVRTARRQRPYGQCLDFQDGPLRLYEHRLAHTPLRHFLANVITIPALPSIIPALPGTPTSDLSSGSLGR